MNEVIYAAAIMSSLAFFFGAVLAISNRFLKVEEDPRIDMVEELLPGSNCGACGEAGCRAFAEELVKGTLSPGKCTVSGSETVEQIAKLLGVDAGKEDKRVARLHCAGGHSSVVKLAEYQGLESCRGAFVVNNGGRACPWGCLGLGDCQRVCQFEAIKIGDQGLPIVDVDKCTACGDCVDVCPLNLFSIQKLDHKVVLQCSSPLSSDQAKMICVLACDGCGRCALDAEEGAIEMVSSLPVIKDPDRVTEECTYRCPTGAITVVEKNQFEQDEVAAPATRRRYG